MKIITTKKYSQVVYNMKNELGNKLLSLRTGDGSAIYQVGFGWTNNEYIPDSLIREAVQELSDIISMLQIQKSDQRAKQYLKIKDQLQRSMSKDDDLWSNCH